MLTSCIFGFFRYHPDPDLLLRFLRRARTIDGELLSDEQLPDGTRFRDARFWKRVKHDGAIHEPDIVFTAPGIAVVIECKYLLSAPDPEQLRRYANLLSAHHGGDSKILILLTRHYLMPREALDPIRTKRGELITPYWLSWRDAYAVAKSARRNSDRPNTLLEDFLGFMRRRGLTRFDGVEVAEHDWNYRPYERDYFRFAECEIKWRFKADG